MKAALLIIDMQNDFVEQGSLFEVKGIRHNIREFKGFINACRSNRVTIIYTRHCFDPKNNKIEARLFPDMAEAGLRKGTPGWQICDDLMPRDDDIVIDKTRYDAFFKTGLKGMLESRDIDTVIITGTITNVCCETTARTAMQHDYNVIFCSDLTYCSHPESHKNTLRSMRMFFGKVMPSAEILKEVVEE